MADHSWGLPEGFRQLLQVASGGKVLGNWAVTANGPSFSLMPDRIYVRNAEPGAEVMVTWMDEDRRVWSSQLRVPGYWAAGLDAITGD